MTIFVCKLEATPSRYDGRTNTARVRLNSMTSWTCLSRTVQIPIRRKKRKKSSQTKSVYDHNIVIIFSNNFQITKINYYRLRNKSHKFVQTHEMLGAYWLLLNSLQLYGVGNVAHQLRSFYFTHFLQQVLSLQHFRFRKTGRVTHLNWLAVHWPTGRR